MSEPCRVAETQSRTNLQVYKLKMSEPNRGISEQEELAKYIIKHV